MRRPGRLRRSVLTTSALVALSAWASALAAPAKPTAPKGARAFKQYTIEQFMNTTSLRDASFAPDEKTLLFSSDESGIFNAYTLPIAGGKPTAVTRSSTDSTFAVAFFPADGRILFEHDQGGNENTHLYVRELDGSERDLTPGSKLRARFAGFSHDDKAFYVKTNERDPRFFDLYRYETAGYQRKLVYKDEVGYQLGPISDDGNWIAFSKLHTTSDSDIFLYSVASRQMKLISAHKGTADYDPATFDRASKWLYFLTNDGTEFLRVRRLELSSGKTEDVEQAPWDILFTDFSWNGSYRVSGINVDGRTQIKIYDTQTGAPLALPKLPDGEIRRPVIARSEKRMAFFVNGSRAPSDLYVYDFASKRATRLTQSLNKEIDSQHLVDAQVVRFHSFDGLAIPNLLFKPREASPEHKAPALVFVHGGPGGQTRVGYNPLVQYLVNHGYVLLGINNRGSSGYGKSFFVADDRKHGREPLWDCVAAKTYLATLPYVDAERVGIIGGSYGGYMVLAALAFRPEAFALGVDFFGVSNWVRTIKSMPVYWESARKALYAEIGDPGADEKMLREISPLFHVDQIRKPLLVLQGANDPRVIKAESDDIVNGLRKRGVPVEYVVFPDEGHGFTKKKNEIQGDRAVLEFLDKYLKPAPAGAAGAR